MSFAQSAPVQPSSVPLAARLTALEQQIADQRRQIDTLQREVAAQRAHRAEPGGTDTVDAQALEAARGGGKVDGGDAPAQPGAAQAGAAPAGTVQASAAQAGAAQAGQSSTPMDNAAAQASPPTATVAQASAPPSAAAQASAPPSAAAPQAAAVGKPPAANSRPPEVAPLFEQPGVLTPKGKYVLEPGLQYAYSSSNRVALVGYTVIPALLIGLVDVREVKRNTTTATFSARTGLSNRLELEVKIPYVYRSDSTVSREIFTGTAVENVFDTSGKHMGDAEIGLRYQLNNGGPDKAYYVGALRVKSRTGRDPFEVVTDCTRRCIGPNATGTGLPLQLPTGSGFHSIQPSLTWLFPSDPAVFFGSVSYLHNVKRSNISRTVLNGEQELLGEIKPGGIAGFNFGMGLGLNDKASLSLGYDHASIARTRQDGRPVPGSVRMQLGTLLLGFSYRISDKRSLNVSVGAGLTRDTPDVSLNVRMPLTF